MSGSVGAGSSLTGEHFTIASLQIFRQSLWDFFLASFPCVTYCLASATLTDEAVLDILSIY